MRNLKALVVDDSKVGRLTMQKKLEAFGVGVDLAESGQEALSYLERQRPDMIFMDHMMPDLDGFETTRRIKAVPATRDIPIIIISGSDDEAFVRDARAIGALDAIAKPPSNDAIKRILASLPQAPAAMAEREVTPAVARATLQTGTTALFDQTAIQAMVEARIGVAIERLHSAWLDELRTRLEAEFANERQLQRGWISRIEQRLDATMTGLADLARVASESEALRQGLHTLDTRLMTLESATAGMTTPTEAWLESVDQRVGPRLTEINEHMAHQAAMLGELRQELLARMADSDAEHDRVSRDLAGRIDALSEAMQQHLATPLEGGHMARLEAIEQRLAALEGAVRLPGLDQASMPVSLEDTLSSRVADMLRERHEPMRAELDRLGERLQTLAQSQEAHGAALSAQGEAMGALIDQRFAQLRAEVDAAIQSALAEPGVVTTQLAADTLPAAAVDQDLEARLVGRLTEEWNGRWQAEVQRLQSKLKTLTLVTAAGGAALLTALIILAT